MTEWAVRATARAGRQEVASGLLEKVPVDLEIGENLPYYHDLLFYKGVMTADQLLNPGEDAPYRKETVGYGIANWLIVQGDTAQAVELLEELVAIYLEDCPGQLEGVRTAVREGDAPALKASAHALKGATSNFTAGEALSMLVELEAAGEENRMDGTTDLLARLEAGMARLVREMGGD